MMQVGQQAVRRRRARAFVRGCDDGRLPADLRQAAASLRLFCFPIRHRADPMTATKTTRKSQVRQGGYCLSLPFSSTARPAPPAWKSAADLAGIAGARGRQHRAAQAQGRGGAARNDAAGRPRRAVPARRRCEGGGGADWLAREPRRPRWSTPALRIASPTAGPMALRNWMPARRRPSRSARHVSNPGCYPTGAIALIRPLVDAGLLPADYPVDGQCGERLQRRRAHA